MTATRLARNKHRLNLNCLAAGLGINPTASQASVGEQFPQGPKCGKGPNVAAALSNCAAKARFREQEI